MAFQPEPRRRRPAQPAGEQAADAQCLALLTSYDRRHQLCARSRAFCVLLTNQTKGHMLPKRVPRPAGVERSGLGCRWAASRGRGSLGQLPCPRAASHQPHLTAPFHAGAVQEPYRLLVQQLLCPRWASRQPHLTAPCHARAAQAAGPAAAPGAQRLAMSRRRAARPAGEQAADTQCLVLLPNSAAATADVPDHARLVWRPACCRLDGRSVCCCSQDLPGMFHLLPFSAPSHWSSCSQQQRHFAPHSAITNCGQLQLPRHGHSLPLTCQVWHKSGSLDKSLERVGQANRSSWNAIPKIVDSSSSLAKVGGALQRFGQVNQSGEMLFKTDRFRTVDSSSSLDEIGGPLERVGQRLQRPLGALLLALHTADTRWQSDCWATFV